MDVMFLQSAAEKGARASAWTGFLRCNMAWIGRLVVVGCRQMMGRG